MIKNLLKKVKLEVKGAIICAKYTPLVATTRRTIRVIKKSINEKEQEITTPKSNTVEEDVIQQEKIKEEQANLEAATDNVYNIFMEFLNGEESTGATPEVEKDTNLATNFGNVKLPKDFEKKENIYSSSNIPPSSPVKGENGNETTNPKKDDSTILQDKRNRLSSSVWKRLKYLFFKNKRQFLKLLKDLFKSFKTFIYTVLITLVSSLSVCVLSIYTLIRELFRALKTFCITLDLKFNMSV